MTTPEASSLKSADDAFSHPLQTTKYFYKQLNLNLEEKNTRLRNLVGGSYRDVLGTAEMILTMREDMESVEEKLARVGKGCGARAVGGKVSGLGGFESTPEAKGKALGWMAQMKVLNGCIMVVGRLLRGKTPTKGGGEAGNPSARAQRLVTGAKVLVIARLLLKSLGESEKDCTVPGTADLIDDSKRQLASLRRRLLRAIDRMLEDTKTNRESLLSALCAYTLATSSGAKDVMRHFLSVRSEALTLAFDEEPLHEAQENDTGVVKSLKLYTKTLLDVQALVPRRLSEALQRLKDKALLANSDVRDLEGMRLDVCERWFSDETKHFIPYIRHDELDGPAAKEMLFSWAKRSEEALLQGFTRTLGVCNDFKTLVDLRTNVLEVWIKEGGKAKGFDSSVMLDGLRDILNKRSIELLESRSNKLHLVGTEIEAALAGWVDSVTNRRESLWDENKFDADLSHGATRFKNSVIDRMHGRNDAVSRVLHGYQTWRHLIADVFEVIDQLKKQKWDEDLEDIDDDLALENRNTLLSVDDPRLLQDHLDTALTSSFKALHDKVEALLSTHKDQSNFGSQAMFILRVLRDLRSDLPEHEKIQSFGLSLVPELHKTIVITACTEPLVAFKKTTFARKKIMGRALWEGSPELPVQPSPIVFKFMRKLMEEMMNAGADLWSPVAIAALKMHVVTELAEPWVKTLESQTEDTKAETSGTNDEPSEKTEDTQAIDNASKDAMRDVWTQSLFDVELLRLCLQSDKKGSDKLAALSKALELKLSLESSPRKRLQRGVNEYWKRTSLLFGLLA